TRLVSSTGFLAGAVTTRGYRARSRREDTRCEHTGHEALGVTRPRRARTGEGVDRAGTRSVDEGAQGVFVAALAELAEGEGLDLADALAADAEDLADLGEGVDLARADAEAHAEDLLLAGREHAQRAQDVLLEVVVDDAVHRRGRALVLDEVGELAAAVVADGGLEADRVAADREQIAHLVDGHLHRLRELFRRRLAAELAHELARDAHHLVEALEGVHRQADRPRLVRGGARDRLADPPRGVGRELVAAAVVELLDRAHEADVALLDEVQEREAPLHVLLRDRDDEAQVRLHHLGLGRLDLVLGAAQLAVVRAHDVARAAGVLLHLL